MDDGRRLSCVGAHIEPLESPCVGAECIACLTYIISTKIRSSRVLVSISVEALEILDLLFSSFSR